ncbi:AMP-binding protein [Pseudomonas aeruginosa]|uniref:AMP-binding protein n=1 Tax=Pseudomonas aeruginosa TaxID=287 RepID=UPI00071BF35E|nr:AMP-binding protein [Pseudomonas aeruginosa]KSE28089.1 cyclohexanecarboxylate-CoA ligase [Pseudomonas aeruginosa]KSG99988.1 cyclohexanecarboxylate-CoA ligase [Pseudomonas aeruginosa]KSS49728.1 cyclohexanecarboxylate-CoA ligase [Pseudomonas aeruginosa]MBA5113593.1 AMP-binding protein [Pseudomonas aeruginosa]WBJ20542.1 Medium-chain fatty-acid--CoA ligase [Pseudomonas aeruginosa]
MAAQLLEAPTLWALLQRRVALTPQATMLIDGRKRQRMTFAQALDISARLAAGFQRYGIGQGSVVTWQLPTGIPAVMTAFALARLGAVQNPIISLYGEREVHGVVARNRSDFLLVPGAQERDFRLMAERIRDSLEHPLRVIVMAGDLPQGKAVDLPPAPEDGEAVRWVYYTSGTTSEPKGACHSDQTLMIGGRNLARAMQVGSADVGTVAFPYAHIGGAMYTAMLLASGMSAVLLDRFQAAEAVAIFREFGVTTTGGSTAHYEALLAEQRRQPSARLIPSLRLLCGGGAPKPPELYYQVTTELGCALTHNYGMTEVPLICAGSPSHGDDQLACSEGLPVDEVELRIVRLDGSLADIEESGEVRVRGRGVFKGYTDKALDEEAFDADGYFRTGDLGLLRSDGRVTLTGRLKDVIIRKGENISARELEDLLYSHPKVGAVAVIGLPDAERGERVCAVVEPAPGKPPLEFAEMVAYFRSSGIMLQKIPEQLELVDSLPRNETLNKVLKHVLRQRFTT